MKKSFLFLGSMLVFAAAAAAGRPGQDSGNPVSATRVYQHVSLQAGLNSHRPTAEPFGAMPFALGLCYERGFRDNWGIGGTLMFDRWSDYLGMLGGKYTFHVFRPSFDFVYHFKLGKMKGLDIFAGTHLGYSFFWITNELGNSYEGDLRHEPHIAPFIGMNLHFGKAASGLWTRLSLTARAAWSVTGRLSGIYGTAGVVYRIK